MSSKQKIRKQRRKRVLALLIYFIVYWTVVSPLLVTPIMHPYSEIDKAQTYTYNVYDKILPDLLKLAYQRSSISPWMVNRIEVVNINPSTSYGIKILQLNDALKEIKEDLNPNEGYMDLTDEQDISIYWHLGTLRVQSLYPIPIDAFVGDGWKNGSFFKMHTFVKEIKLSNVCSINEENYNSKLDGLFADCHNLKTVSFEGSSISNVSSLNSMFKNCRSLKNVNFLGVDLSQVVSAENMYENCESLQLVTDNLVNFPNLTNSTKMFKGCSKLIGVYISENNTLSNLQNATGMFESCTRLTVVNLTNLKNQSALITNNMFKNCVGLRKINIENANISQNPTDIKNMYQNCNQLDYLLDK